MTQLRERDHGRWQNSKKLISDFWSIIPSNIKGPPLLPLSSLTPVDINQRQYQLILSQGLIPKERLDQAYSHPNRRIYNDFIEFLIHSMMLRADIALTIRQQSLQPIPTNEPLQSPSQLMSPADFEQLYLRAQHSSPLFSPHARVQFKLLEKLGEGGMGVVHRIEDKKLGRNAALKVLGSIDADERTITRFIREARITASLVHPNIPPIYELGMNSSGEHYMLMKVIEGQSLRQAIREVHSEGKADPKEIRRLLEALVKVCEAMAYAHSKNVIHRDLKPENIMIGEFGEVMVLDWGLARDLGDSEDIDLNGQKSMRLKEAAIKEGLTGAGDLLGTVGYMAPEQIDGEACKQSDVFALGTILTEVLTGKKAIEGEGVIAKLSATIQGRIHNPRALLSSAPKELNALAIKAMAMTRSNRVADVEELVRDLKAYLEGAELTVYRYGLVTRSQRWVSRHPTFVSAAALLMVLGFVGLYFQVSLSESDRARLASERQKEVAKTTRERLVTSLELFNKAENAADRGLSEAEIINDIEEALRLGGRGKASLLRGAGIYRKAKLFEQCQSLLDECIKSYSPAFEALYRKHLVETRNDRKRRLTDPLKEILRLGEVHKLQNEFVLIAQAVKACLDKEWERAIECCDKAEDLAPDHFEIYSSRGLAKAELGEDRNAIKDYDRSILLNGNSAYVFFNLGISQYRLRQYSRAEEVFTRGLILLPEDALALRRRGEVRLQLGLTIVAESDFRRAVKISPKDIYAKHMLGACLRMQGRNKEAISVLSEAISIDDSERLLYSERGEVYQQLGQYEKAVSDFNKSISLGPKFWVGYHGKGRALLYLKRYQDALQALKKSVEINSKHAQTYYLLARVLSELGRTEDAVRALSQAILISRTFPDFYYLRGQLWRKLRRLKEALTDFERTLKLRPDFYEAIRQRGSTKLELGDNKGAALDFELCLKLRKHSQLETAQFRQFIEKHLGRRSRY